MHKITLSALLILGFSGTLLPYQASACKISKTSNYYWNEDQLVSKTPLILWVEVEKIISEVAEKKSTGVSLAKAKYIFKVKKVLKRKYDQPVYSSDAFFVATGPYTDYTNVHSTIDFVGKSGYGLDCQIYATGYERKSYLLFVGAYHPNFFEEVENEKDPWFVRVQNLINRT